MTMLQTAVLLAFIATLQIAYAWTGDELVQAVTDNDLNKLAVILGEKTHPDVTDKVGWTGLLTASRMSNIAAAQRLIAAGANVNVAETDGWTPLHFCVALNNAQMCKVLIDGGANILLKNKNGQFPLAAVEEGHNEELKRIFADALSRNSNQRQQQAPPAAAAKLPSYDEVFKQVRQGNLLAFNEAVSTFRSTNTPFDFNHKDAAGFTLAHCICAATPVNPEMFKFLMSGRSSANLNHQENDGWTALMFLAVHDKAAFVDPLLAAGADVNIRNKNGKTAYELAEAQGYKKIAQTIATSGVINVLNYAMTPAGRQDIHVASKLVEFVTRYRVSPNVVSPGPEASGITPLMLVALKDNNRGRFIEDMAKSGANLFVADNHGWTPLMYAIASNRPESVEMLLKLGNFDRKFFNVVTPDEETPFSVAAEVGNEAIVNMLKEHNPSAFVLPQGATRYQAVPPAKGSVDTRRKTGSRGSSYSNSQNAAKANPQIRAASQNQPPPPRAGVKPLSTVVKNKYAVELVDAVLANNIQSVKYYLADGGDYTYAHKGGYNALIHSAAKGFLDITKLLLTNGANPNAAENDGWTSLMFAAFQGRVDAVDALLDAGADACAANKAGFMAHSLAISNGHKQVGARVASECLARKIHDEDAKAVLTLLRSGANPTMSDPQSGRTVLIALVASKDITVPQVEAFLREFSFIDVNQGDKESQSALFYAVDRGDLAMTAVLIANGADTQKRNRRGVTPADIAKTRANKDIMNLLERYPTVESMQKALDNLRSIHGSKNMHKGPNDIEHQPHVDPAMLLNLEQSGVQQQSSSNDAEELRKQNAELQKNLAQIAEKARQEYGNKAKQRAIEEKQHKDKILAAEKKKKDQEGKGFFAKLFGF